MNDKLDAYSLNVKFAKNVIGELSQNKETGLLKLDYNDDWQQNGLPYLQVLRLIIITITLLHITFLITLYLKEKLDYSLQKGQAFQKRIFSHMYVK